MATYNSTALIANQPPISHGFANSLKCAYASVACAASPATTDTLNFFDLPPGARVIYSILKSSDMDTNGSPTITLNIGDSGSASRYFSASTVAQAGTAAVATAAGGLDYSVASTKTRITGTAAANAATGAAGTVELSMFYIVEGVAS